MVIEHMTEELLNSMYEEHHKMMDAIQNILWDENQKDKHPQYYNSYTHNFLKRNAWEILFPVPQEEWFRSLQDLNQYNKEMPWPQYAPYQYSMDVLFPPNLQASALYFGYAILEDGTVKKTCFFNWMKIVNYQVMPQGVVMDPLAKLHDISVKYYVGVPLDREDLERFISRTPGHPLENYVTRKNKEEHEKRLHDSYMESYYLQMQYEPHYLPYALQEFAKANGLPFPKDQRSDN